MTKFWDHHQASDDFDGVEENLHIDSDFCYSLIVSEAAATCSGKDST
jgi:hypothetical protein